MRPWNRFAHKSLEPNFAVRHGLDDVAFTELFGWNEETFSKKFSGSAIYLIGHENGCATSLWRWVRPPNSIEVLAALRKPMLKMRLLSPTFYCDFQSTPEDTVARSIYSLGSQQWEISKLRDLLENILAHSQSF